MSITKIQVPDNKMVSFAKVCFLVSLKKQFQKYLFASILTDDFFQINLHVNKEKLLIDSFYLFPC